MRHAQDHVYRSRSQVFTIIVAMLAYDFLMVTLIVTKPDRNHANDYAIVSMIILNPIAWRAAICSVVASRAGVRVVNMFKTFEVPWGEIGEFDIGQSGLFPQVCRIHTLDGKVLRAFGIQEMNVSLLQSQEDKRPARKIVEQLNQELADHTNGAPGVQQQTYAQSSRPSHPR
jgi:hypothetical protein